MRIAQVSAYLLVALVSLPRRQIVENEIEVEFACDRYVKRNHIPTPQQSSPFAFYCSSP
jgi:hypothetical protein